MMYPIYLIQVSLDGLKKLGQPLFDLNLCFESNKVELQQTHKYFPFRKKLLYSPLKRGSVPFFG